MLYYYNGKYVAALVDLFPNIDLDPAKFINIPSKYQARKREEGGRDGAGGGRREGERGGGRGEGRGERGGERGEGRGERGGS